MALTEQQAEALLPKLANYLAREKWLNLSVTEFDAGYASLTTTEKHTILDSVINGDDRAKQLIKSRLNGPVKVWATQQAQSYIAANSIPVDVIANIF